MTLPLFENEPVDHATVKIVKAAAAQPRALHIGDDVSYVITGTCTQVNHRDDDDQVTRVHTIEAHHISEIPPDVAQKLLADAEQRAIDATGQPPLPDA